MISYVINHSALFFARERKLFGAARSKSLSCLQEDIARKTAKVEGRVVLDFAVAEMEKLARHAK